VRVIIQRVLSASVSWSDIDGSTRNNQIGRGMVVLAGAGGDDSAATVERMATKVAQLRIFQDAEGRTNLSLEEVKGEALVVSQFTLYADLSRGRRPSFLGAGDPAHAAALLERFGAHLSGRGIITRTGSFGASMLVSLENDGPFTLALSNDTWQTRISG